MKIKGTTVSATYNETIVIPRPNTEYVFKARPLTTADDELFDTLCPAPVAPVYTKPGGAVENDEQDAGYLEALKVRATRTSEWLFMRSLDATPDLEWDTVILDEPSTWGNVEKELADSGFTSSEVLAILNAVISANGLDASKIDKATKSFLATQAAADI